MMNIKKVTKICFGVLMTVFVLGNGNFTRAKEFYIALAPDRCWRAVDAPDTKDTKDNMNTLYGYVNLDTIYDGGDSYNIDVKAVDNVDELESASNQYSQEVCVNKNTGRKSILEQYDGKQMSLHETYYITVKNYNSTHDYRDCSGTFGWN